MFEHLVGQINASIKGSVNEEGKFIGLLDVYG